LTEIAIYAEGGGDTTEQKAQLRQGFDGLLCNSKSSARAKRLGWKVVPCGGRQAAYDAFINAVHSNPAAVNVLLVDSETLVKANAGGVTQDPAVCVAHLTQQDNWNLREVQAERVHLMAQCMETWIVADPAALEKFYGKKFASKDLPSRILLEEEPKRDVYDKLAKATRETQKGEYHEIRHASQLLQKIDPTKVAQRCPRFAILTCWLDGTIEACR